MTKKKDKRTEGHEITEFTLSHVLVEGHMPSDTDIKFSIGPYKIIQSIGKGGMGEVFLAYDTICGRRIALKRIREDLLSYKQINTRFLKEAHVTSQLTHPSIIPIYAIHKEESLVYYTMPFVEGETLKQILRTARTLEKSGKKSDHIGCSIPGLIRIFINICQAIAYAHSKKVLHRDLKPENIIVGQYGEVLILDWGLAKLIRDTSQGGQEDESIEPEPKIKMHLSGLTKIGKVVGTVTYMAPERASGHPSTYQTDIYSLGVILYQMLTLHFPFHRRSLEEFRKNMHKEKLQDPTKIAPYRDVPRVLARIVKKCLEPIPSHRYQNVDELIKDLENYIEGRAEWFQIATLRPENKGDWEFQENVYLPEHLAITRSTETSDWMSLMISKASFADNIKLEATVKLGENSHGLGFLLSIPEISQRKHLNDGYCLWLGSDTNKSTKLMRSTVEVMHTPDIVLNRNEWYNVRIDKSENIIYFYLNNTLQFSYISHIPLVGTHIGILSRDADYIIKDFNVFVGGQNVTVKCLAVPDAFLANKQYEAALSEYRRIGYSFPGRAEGREAMFRAGITLLEQAKNCPDPKKAEEYYRLALMEFEKLHKTPGAPLEYLGKALVYQSLKEYDEEIKCFELGCRRYPKHPFLPILHEQIIYRMHESSRYQRKTTYQFILLCVRQLQENDPGLHVKKLFNSLKNHWEPLPFIEEPENIDENSALSNHLFSITLAFWLAKPYVLEEIIHDLLKIESPPIFAISNALIAMIKIGSFNLATSLVEQIKDLQPEFGNTHLKALELILDFHTHPSREFIAQKFNDELPLDFQTERALLQMMEMCLDNDRTDIVHDIYDKVIEKKPSSTQKVLFDAYQIWAYLLEGNREKSSALLLNHSIEELTQEEHILHCLYGCWLQISEGNELAMIHFASALETTFPRTWALLGHYLTGKIHDDHVWFQRAFLWEKKMLYRQLKLYYRCINDLEKARHYHELINQESLRL